MTDYQFVAGDAHLSPLLLLHGTGGTEQDLIPIGHFLAPHAPLLSIRGRLVEQGQTRYFRHTATGGFDLADLAHQTDWLLGEVASLSARHHLDATRLIVVGYSNGANVAARAMLTRPVPFSAGIFLHAMSLGPLTATRDLTHTTIWASHGRQDPIVTSSNFAALMAAFKAAHATVATFTHDEYHNLTKAELLAARAWLHQSGRLKEA